LHDRLQPAVRASAGPPAVSWSNLFVAVCALAGVVLPSEVQLTLLDGARFTSGRLAAALLLLPALCTLLQKGRRLQWSDLFACSTALWMLLTSFNAVGSLTASGGDALDFLGGYLIGRAFIFGRPALDAFVRVLRIFAFIVIVLAMADSVSGSWIVHAAFSTIVRVDPSVLAPALRNGMIRAISTFDHEILFGLFCALTAAILLYWEENSLHRTLAAGFCFLGCLLSLSSVACMVFAIVFSCFTFDRLLSQYRWRWGAFWMVVGLVALAFFVVVPHPLSWILSHLTLDPQTGYFRITIWQVASDYVAQSPIIGYGYQRFDNWVLDMTVDSIWLIYCLRFGLPIAILLILTNVTTLLPVKRTSVGGPNEDYVDRMSRAFALVILTFMFAGITVHFWNYMLMFWGLCIGIRASLRELRMGTLGGTFGRSRRKIGLGRRVRSNSLGIRPLV
jgi:hypothetical protein